METEYPLNNKAAYTVSGHARNSRCSGVNTWNHRWYWRSSLVLLYSYLGNFLFRTLVDTMKLMLCLAVFLGYLNSISVPTHAQTDVRDLVKKATPAIVTIAVFDSTGTIYGIGSGFFVENDQIITSRHVVETAYRAEYRTSDGTIYPVLGVTGDDPYADLAQLQVEVPATEVSPLPISEASTEIGERIIAIGSPHGLELTVSEGIVSSVRDDPFVGRFLQLTAPISQGSSGGPILNLQGEVVGIASMILTTGQNLNFATPAKRITSMKIEPLQPFTAWRATAHNTTVAPPLYSDDPAKAAFLADYALSRARAYFEREEFETAIQMSNTALMIRPDLGDAWLINGMSELYLHHYDHAIVPLQQALRLMPKDPMPRIQLGDAFAGLQQYDEALKQYRDVLNNDSTYGLAWNGIGQMEFLKGEDSAAIIALERAVSYNSTIFEAYRALGTLYYKRNQLREAEAAYKNVLRIVPNHPETLEELSVVYRELGNYRESLSLLQGLLKERPDDPDLLLKLGSILTRIEKYPEAIEAFEGSLSIRPEHGIAHFMLGTVYMHQKNYDEGMKEYIEAIRYDPGLAEAHHGLGMAYLHYKNDKAAALDEYKILLTLDKNLAKMLFDDIYR